MTEHWSKTEEGKNQLLQLLNENFRFHKDGSITEREQLSAEFGSTDSVRFLGPEKVTMYDSEGNGIEIPKCEMCGAHKQALIGKSAYAWICPWGCAPTQRDQI